MVEGVGPMSGSGGWEERDVGVETLPTFGEERSPVCERHMLLLLRVSFSTVHVAPHQDDRTCGEERGEDVA